MSWLDHVRLRQAVAAIAKRLPPELKAGWGAAEYYTAGQVRAALGRLRLHGRFESIAFAAYLTKDEYDAHAAEYPMTMPYEDARRLFDRYGRSNWAGYRQEPMSNAQAASRYGVGGGF